MKICAQQDDAYRAERERKRRELELITALHRAFNDVSSAISGYRREVDSSFANEIYDAIYPAKKAVYKRYQDTI